MNTELEYLVKMSQIGDAQCFEILLEKFRNLLDKYNKKISSNYYGIDLDIFFMNIIMNMKFGNDHWNDKQISAYIKKCLINESNKILKKNSRLKTIHIDNNNLYDSVKYDLISNLELSELLKALNDYEFNVLVLTIIYDKTDTYVAKKYNVTRQAINKTKLKALNKLKKLMT